MEKNQSIIKQFIIIKNNLISGLIDLLIYFDNWIVILEYYLYIEFCFHNLRFHCKYIV